MRHVLERPDQAHAGLLRHLRRADRHLLRCRLRRGDDHDLRAWEQLSERDRNVAGPGRHVDDERVELAPVHVGEELLERAVQHRPTPHDRRVLLEEEADRHQLQVAAHRRHDHLVDDDRALCDAQHERDRVAVDVGVENSCSQTEPVERCREVDGQRRLADSALAARDREHPRRGADRDALRPPGDAAAQPLRQLGALVGAHHVELERDRLDAGEREHVLAHLVLEAVSERTTGDRQRDRDRDVTALDEHLAHHVQLGDGPLQLGVDDLSERLGDLLAAWLFHAFEPSSGPTSR